MQDLHNDIAAVNHNGGNDDLGRGTNCLYCTTAYEMRRRGYDVQAQQDWVGGIRGDMPSAMFDGAHTDVVYDISDTSRYGSDRVAITMSATQTLIDTVEAQGEGARGYVGVNWEGGQGGHSMAYEVIDGQMHLIDCQTGDDFTGEDIWTERMAYVECCYITRVDNCDFNKAMVDRYIEDADTKDSTDVLDDMLDRLFDKLKKRQKKKKKKSDSLKKQVNRFGVKLGSLLNSTKRNTSKKASSFINKVKDVI